MLWATKQVMHVKKKKDVLTLPTSNFFSGRDAAKLKTYFKS
jgi:hypothetical protein